MRGGTLFFMLPLIGFSVAVFIASFTQIGLEDDDDEDEDDRYPPYLGETYPEDATPTERQKLWALSVCAVLSEINYSSHYVLGGKTNTSVVVLERDWGITDKETLMEALYGLECGGHRQIYDEWVERYEELSPEEQAAAKLQAFEQGGTISNRMDVMLATRERFKDTGLAGWDFSRYAFLCGRAYRAGHLTEAETWQLLMPVARLMQETFTSWHDLADNYAEGRRFWSLKTYIRNGERARDALNSLKWDLDSPFLHLEWNMNLLPEEQQDDGSKEFRLGRIYFDSFGQRTRVSDKAEALRLFKVAVEKGNVDAMYWLGLCYSRYRSWAGIEENKEKAVYWLTKAAEKGDSPSMVRLATIHINGTPEERKMAFEWVTKAAEKGDLPLADSCMGFFYNLGIGTESDFDKGCYWSEKAARKGEPLGQNNYGCCLRDGEGVAKDIAKAVEWFQKSAESGSSHGMFHWAKSLEHGTCVKKDEAAALRWYRKAAKEGHGASAKRVAELEADQKQDTPAPADG